MIGLGCCLHQVAVGQAFNMRQFGEAAGLPSADVYEVRQDSKGYVWVSTESGVVRYNGYQFSPIPLGGQLEHSDVFGIHEDQKGRIWFRTLSGGMAYMQAGEIHHPGNDSLCRALSFTSPVIRILEKGDRIYFLSQLRGLKELHGDEVRHFDVGYLKAGCIVENGIFMVAYEAYYQLDTMGKVSVVESLESAQQYSTVIQHQGTCYVGHGKLLFKYDLKSQQKDTIDLGPAKEAEIINLASMNDSILLISTRSGVKLLNSHREQIERYDLEGMSVSSCFEDRNGGFWYSTLGNGMIYAPDPERRPLRLFPPMMPKRVFCIFKDSVGGYWIGGERNTVLHWSNGELKRYDLRVPGDTQLDRITNIKEGPGGAIYVLGKRIFSKIEAGKAPQTIFMTGNDFVFDAQEQIWVAGSHGFRNDALDENLTFTRQDSTLTDYRSSKVLMVEDTLFLGTNVGLLYWLEEESRYQPVKGLEGSPIADIQMPYVLTEDSRLFKVNGTEAERIFFDVTLHARSYALRKDGKRILLGTNKGLYYVENGAVRYENALGRTRVYDMESRGDTLLMGTDRGLLSFPLMRNSLENPAPLFYLDSVMVNGRRAEPTGLRDLSYSENNLQIFFTGILYPRRPSYRYRINQEPWYKINVRELTLKLAPGDYTVTLQAINGKDQFSQPIRLYISIAPPLWEQPLVIAAALLLLAVGIVWGIRRYLRKIQKDHTQQRELDQANLRVSESKNRVLELEQKALRLQMNPHFLFNSINSIKGLYAQGKVREAITFIHHFSSFLRVVVNNETALISIQKEVAFLEHYLSLEKMKFPEMDFELSWGDEIEPERMHIPFMLIQPYAENAILHGLGPKKSRGLIKIHIDKLDDTSLLVRIEDDGVGLSGKKITPKKDSVGMRVTAERLALFNEGGQANVKVENREDGPGVRVTFQTRFVYE